MDKVRTVCPFCCLGCGLQLLVDEGKVVGVEYLKEAPNEGALCSRGNTCFELVQHPDRIATPLIRAGEAFREASWDEVLRLLSQKLLEMRSKYGSRSIGVVASARMSNEDCYLTQKFAREVLGTPNIDNPARLTHAATLSLLIRGLGYPWATCTLDFVESSDLVFIVGANPFDVNPVLSRRILRARDGGATVVVVDPRRTKTTWKSDIHLQVKPGRDYELLLSMLNVIATSKMAREEAWKVEGFEEAVKLSEGFAPEKVAEVTGVEARLIREAALRLALSKRPVVIYSHGVTQQPKALSALKALLALSAAVGVFSSGGLIPLSDQNNVQGSCDVGCLADFGPGYAPVEGGLTLAEMIEAVARGDIKALMVVGFDLVASMPDRKFVEEALRNLEMLAVIDLFHTETTKLAHVVLPACSWAEYDGTYTNVEGRVQRAFKAVEPVGRAKPVWMIISDLAKYMGSSGFNYSGWFDVFRELTERVSQYSDLTVDGVSKVGGQVIKKGGGLKISLEGLEPRTWEETQRGYLLIAGRGLHHLDTGERTRRLSFASKEVPEPYIEICRDDAAKMGLVEGDVVEVKGPKGDLKVRVKIVPKGMSGVVFMPIHFPTCNPLSIMKYEIFEGVRAPLPKHSAVELSKAVG